MEVKIKSKWFPILKRDGNYALIQFESGKFCWNIAGFETRKIEYQKQLFSN